VGKYVQKFLIRYSRPYILYCNFHGNRSNICKSGFN
jgi:hypothetical protein